MAHDWEPRLQAFVTGAGGLVGVHLLNALCREGCQITALSRRHSLADDLIEASDKLRFISGDVQDPGLLWSILTSQSFDVIFHLAALNAFADAIDLYRVNVVGTATLLEAVRRLERPELKLIVMGSSAEYGNSADDPIDEGSALAPVTYYGASKACADLMGKALFGETGQKVICARPFNILGPGQRGPLLPAAITRQLVDIVQGRRPPILEVGDLSNYRDYVDARDVAEGLILLARRGVAGEAYNLCSGRATQAKFIVEHLVGLTAVPVTLQTKARTQAPVNIRYQRGSAEKARESLGWSPKIPLEQSLSDMLTFCRAQALADDLAADRAHANPKPESRGQ